MKLEWFLILSKDRIDACGKETKKYHWECQSSDDHSMLIRFFEYDAQIALDEGRLEGNRLSVTLPHSAVLFLRSSESTPDSLQVEIATLEELTQAKQIDEYTKCTLIDMSKKVLAHIAKNYKNVREHPTGIPLCTKTCTDQGKG